MTGSITPGHDAGYLTGSVATGRENYYTGAKTQGEPPGRWSGVWAAEMGLAGEIDKGTFEAIFQAGLDPRDERFADPETRAEAARLGRAPGRYKTTDEMWAGKLGISPERLAELRAEAVAEVQPGVGGQKSVEPVLIVKLAAESGRLAEQVAKMGRDAGRSARQSVPFYDATFSPAKSVTVLHTAVCRMEQEAGQAGRSEEAAHWAGWRADIERAVWAGADAMLDNLSANAGYARVGRHGAGADQWMDARGWVVGRFFQHTSREDDPQLHIHQAILNKQECADGKVRALDGQLLFKNKQGAGSIGDRALMEELTRLRPNVQWKMRADGVGHEVVGVDQAAMDLFSQRTVKLTKKLAAKVEEFKQATGREPNPLELSRLSKDASLATRRAKSKEGMTREEQLQAWTDRLAGKVAGGMHRVALNVCDSDTTAKVETFSPSGVKAEAVAACQAARSTFSRSELLRQVCLALPAHLGTRDRVDLERVANGLVDEILAEREGIVQVTGATPATTMPDELQLASGHSVYVKPGSIRYATAAHVVAEQALRRAAVERGREAVSQAEVDAWMRAGGIGEKLGDDQAAAVRGLCTSGAAVSVLVGPAGTGKSFTLGAFSKAWSDLTGGRVIGLATSQIATEVLAEDMAAAQDDEAVRELADQGVMAMNTARWLLTQRRLHSGRPNRGDEVWRLSRIDKVVIDEASMVDQQVVTEIRQYVDMAGAALIKAGDPRQLPAVGAGGGMAMLVEDGIAETYHLADVRRFTAEWERTASLRLRDGDRDVLSEYDRRGRIIDAGTLENAIHDSARAYVADSLTGRSALVVVPTNEVAARVSAEIREQRVALGQVHDDGVFLERDGNLAGVGDLVMARRNEWDIAVTNRRRYEVVEVSDDGSMRVRIEGSDKYRTLPADYVREDVILAYAGTVHAVEGVTVDTATEIVTSQMSPEALYVGMTRGRENNTARVVTLAEVPGETTGETHARGRLTTDGVLGDILDREQDMERAALMQQAEDVRRAGDMHTVMAWHEAGVAEVCRRRTDRWLDKMAAEGALTAAERSLLAADQGTEQLSHLLRVVEQAGHDPEEALRQAVAGRSLDGLQSLAQGIHARIDKVYEDLTPQSEHLGDIMPAGINEQWQAHLTELAEAADARRRKLGSQVAEDLPPWAVDNLGPVPDDLVERAEWEHKAGIVAAYREATKEDSDVNPVGASPGLSSPERRAAWHAAWIAMDRPEAGTEERDLPEGALRVRMKAGQREREWQPPYVDAQMRATALEATQHRQDAAYLAAQAKATTDEAERARLLEESAEKEAMAARLADIEADLSDVAEQRAQWIAETAATLDAADRAQEELGRRGVDIGAEPDRVTAADWLAEHQAAMVAEDPHRPVYETDVVDEHQAETEQVGEVSSNVNADTATREVAAEVEPDMPAGVPSVVEVEVAVTAATVAADEIADRQSAEHAQRDAENTRQAAEAEASREAHHRAEQERIEAERVAEQEYADALD